MGRLARIAAAALLAGCGAASGSPEASLAELRSALERRDAAAAYALMSSSYRARVPFDAFRAHVEDEDERGEALALLAGVEGPAEIEARLVLPDGQEVLLRSEGGAFRLESEIVDYYSQRTPRDALRSFVRAADHRRFDVLLRLLPRRDRAGLDAETLAARWAADPEGVERMVGALRTSLDGPIETSADRATLTTSSAHATFVLEADGWVVEDPD